ncbi:MAG: DUF4404 family protein [Deltaproteobacteria bacterium]|nr:DUF4404 family protein [Deltaproteobacteria bacterium]
MSEEHAALRETLSRLHEQIAGHDLDEQERALLRDALQELEGTLEGTPSEEESSLADRLSELAQGFEESHPTLSETVGRVVDALANLGI